MSPLCKFLPSDIREPSGGGGGSGKSVRATGDKGQQEKHHLMYQHYQSSYELTDWSSMHKSKVHLHQVLWIYILIFIFVLLWDSDHVAEWASDFSAISSSFLLVLVCPCPTMMWWTAFVLSHYIVFCYVWLFSLWNLFFSNETQKGSGIRWEGKWRGNGRMTCSQDIWCKK